MECFVVKESTPTARTETRARINLTRPANKQASAEYEIYVVRHYQLYKPHNFL